MFTDPLRLNTHFKISFSRPFLLGKQSIIFMKDILPYDMDLNRSRFLVIHFYCWGPRDKECRMVYDQYIKWLKSNEFQLSQVSRKGVNKGIEHVKNSSDSFKIYYDGDKETIDILATYII